MKMLKVMAASVLIPHGVVKLTKDQADRRRALLDKVSGKDQYVLMAPSTFKRGEVFGWDSYIAKAWGGDLIDVEVVPDEAPNQ